MRLSKRIILLGSIAGLLLLSNCNDITGESSAPGAIDADVGLSMVPAEDRHLSEEQRAAYRKDAEKLAVRYVNEKDSTQTEIPDQLIDLLYNGLVHVVNSDHPKAREATEIYPVHARMPYKPREILVFADSTATWVDAWRNEQTKTGNEKIDELVDRFDFTLVDFSELEHVLPTVMASLKSGRAINGYAVGRLFKEHNDIESAGPDVVTDGNDIKVLFFDDHLRFTFEYGFGDCPAGCISRHYWHFRVYRDGSVEFIGEEGPLPEG